ncbi:MAG: ABC transporter ATP-binding protein [Anaerolineales bacterium]|nr:ABC transporter ATP-binding protein [Anaerolineales bacterium]
MSHVTLDRLSLRHMGQRALALSELSLDIPAGRVTALLGPSGSGKSTTLKLIAGLLTPTAGDIRFDGQSVVTLPPEKRDVAMVFQNHLLFPFLTVAENVGFGLKMRRTPPDQIRTRVDALLDVVQLQGLGERRPEALSGGQAQRVALARALIVEPRLLLLDEPLSNLDRHLREEMRQLILTVQQAYGITTIIVTHDQEEALLLAEQIALLLDGELAQAGDGQTLFERPASVAVARFFGGRNFLPGQRRGAEVTTALGCFRLCDGGGPQGAVTLTIRPERLQVVALEAASDANHLTATICDANYRGSDTRLCLQQGAHHFEAVVPAADFATWRIGQAVALHLPAEALWVVEGEG